MLLMVSDTHRIDQTHKVCITLEVIDKHTASAATHIGPEMPTLPHLCV